MEHLGRIAEVVLAAFGSMKFMHECYEVVHHLVKLVKK
jgi:hypothetical protein